MYDTRLQPEASLERANDPLELMRTRREKIQLFRTFLERSPQVLALFRQAELAEQAARVASADQVEVAPEPEPQAPTVAATEVDQQTQTAEEALARVMAIHQGESYDQKAA